MRILITGGSGFVGSSLAKFLEEKGHHVLVTYRNPVKIKDIFKKYRINLVLWDQDFNFLRNLQKIDCIIHLAGPNASECKINPNGSIDFRKNSTLSLMNFAFQSNVNKFIYISTAHVYRNPLIGLISEDTPVKNNHPYAISHLAAENIIQASNSSNKIQKIVLRVSNLFGVPVHKEIDCWELLINDLCKQAVQTRMLTLKTDGLAQRNYLSMVDFCFKVEKILEGKGAFIESGIYNLGSNQTLAVIDVARIIQKRCLDILGFEPEIFIHPSERKHTTDRLIYKIDKIDKFFLKEMKDLFISEIDALLKYCKLEFA
jgi:UDP-glucose 4-epimerase